jgi:hypothetical protein
MLQMPPYIFSGGTPPPEADLRHRMRECVYRKSGGTPPPELTLVFWGVPVCMNHVCFCWGGGAFPAAA